MASVYYKDWQNLLQGKTVGKDNFQTYTDLETEAYRKILKDKKTTFEGTFSSLAEELGFTNHPYIFIGFLEGIADAIEDFRLAPGTEIPPLPAGQKDPADVVDKDKLSDEEKAHLKKVSDFTAYVDSADADKDLALDFTIDWRRLFIAMRKAKASWLIELPEWDNVYSKEERLEMTREFHRSQMAHSDKVGRNDPCPCGSGKKYKNCHGKVKATLDQD